MLTIRAVWRFISEATMSAICNQARIAANIARMMPALSRDAAKAMCARFGVPAAILTRARQLAEAERNNLRG